MSNSRSQKKITLMGRIEMSKAVMFLLISIFLLFSCLGLNMESQSDLEFTNPILAGFYPDPSICRVGDDYYLVNSTFAYFPGIPVFHSKDMVNWKLIGHVMDRPEQMELEGLGVSRGIFAPAIRYHQDLFYVTCTLVDAGGNFIVTSKNPEGPYSNPVWIPEIDGIDPSMFFDDNGKSYIIYNSIPPDNKPLYGGHRTIRMYEFDLQKMKVKGDEIILVNGGSDITKKPIWIEGPHIFKKNGYYYLISAEGGTSYDHSEVVFRSKKVDGPYESYAGNPILTQRDLDPNRKNPITSTGHADFVMTQSGDWWSVFLGCRPYEEDFYNTGRETFLAPVKWIDGWPVINPDYDEVQYHYPYPVTPDNENVVRAFSGNFTIRDDFDKDKLNPDWMFLRTPHEKWYELNSEEKTLTIDLRPETCSKYKNPSFLGHRQEHMKGSAIVSMNFSPESENEKAGLLAFQNEKYFYYLCKSIKSGKEVIELFKSDETGKADNGMTLLASEEINTADSKGVYLKIEANGNSYSFFYGISSEVWHPVKENLDARFLSTKIAGGFVGAFYALYATSLEKPSDNKAQYNWFEYHGNDEIYK